MAILAWLRSSGAFAARSQARALFDLVMLIAMLEGMRLVCFYAIHWETFGRTIEPIQIAKQSLEAWPDELVATFSRARPNSAPELAFNQPLPLQLKLPEWIASSCNLALSFTLRSAVLLPFVPERPSVVLTEDDEARLRRAGSPPEVHLAFTRRGLYLVGGAGFHKDGSRSVFPSLPYQVLETAASVACEPSLRGARLEAYANRHNHHSPAAVEYRCSKRHVTRWVHALTGRAAHGAGLGRGYARRAP